MIRSDVFREVRVRKINSAPGPNDFFHVVNYTVAQRLAAVPVALPDVTEALAEVAGADFMRTVAESGALSGALQQSQKH